MIYHYLFLCWTGYSIVSSLWKLLKLVRGHQLRNKWFLSGLYCMTIILAITNFLTLKFAYLWCIIYGIQGFITDYGERERHDTITTFKAYLADLCLLLLGLIFWFYPET